MNEKKLFLLDAYALIYRAYYALIRTPRITSKGFNTSAIFGFCNTLDDLLIKESPSHIAVCFDPKGGTFRHEVYPEYKAQRDAQPEDITNSIPYIKEIIKAHNIPVVEVPGYEADDVIGTLATRACKEGYTTYMMTPDKDYGQLVTDCIYMYRPALKGAGFEVRGVKEVCDRYGISSPRQVIDLLALEGDASDNIPGCPGVGEKTAVKLIEEWGSVENLLENTAALKGALQKKIVENADKIKFSKFLVTIKTDVPVDIEIDDLARRADDNDRLKEIYKELEFYSFVKRLSAESGDVQPVVAQPAVASVAPSLFDIPSLFDDPAEESVASVAVDCQIADTPDKVTQVVNAAMNSALVGIAICAIGENAMTARLHGIAIAPKDEHPSFVPLTSANRDELKAIVAQLFNVGNHTIVSHDIKRDYIIMKNEGIDFSVRYYDTSVAHYLLQPEMRHALSNVALTYLGRHSSDYIGEKIGKSGENPTTKALATQYGEIADIVLKLHDCLKGELSDPQLSALMENVELPLIKVLADMEMTGVRVDAHELNKMSGHLTAKLHEMESQAYELAGCEFNIASPMQVGDVLFGRLKIDEKAKRTKTGAYSTTEEILEKYRSTHPVVDLILKTRGLRKLLTTYINALPELINPTTGKIHTSFNQTVTATGRLSSANPNLQNIPIRTDDGREIRRAFIADPGDLLMSADYSQIELRVIADLSGDVDMIEAFLSDADIHRATAAKIYKLPIEQVTDDQRRKAKTANFGIIYGISAFGLAERIGISRQEAKQLIADYFASFPHIREYLDSTLEKARRDGYVSTLMGRKRMLPDINSRNAVVRGYAERNAINAPVQGSAADIIKIAMVNIDKAFKEAQLQSRMTMQVHDELVFNVKPAELETVKEIVVREMENAYHGRVPLTVSTGIASNWLEAH